tara:strand:- start:6 stop:533 length:528 start_codon:yes stop_codon:yes gene_type:complete
MNNQRQFLQQSLSIKNLSSIFALYFYSLGSLFLGYSVYLIYTLNSENSPTSWAGESLFWGLIVFFIAIFVLFLPVEFFSKSRVQNAGFNEMIVNILGIIFISLLFLLIFQTLIQVENKVISDLKFITRSVSFSGFIVMPITLFVLNNVSRKFKTIDNYGFAMLLFVWILSSQLFL